MRLTRALVRLLCLLLLPALLSLPVPATAEELPPPPTDGRDLDGVVTVSDGTGASHTPRTASSGEDVHVAWIERGQASVRTLTSGGRSPLPTRVPTSPDGGRALEVDVAAAGDRAYLVWDVVGTGTAGGYNEVWIAVSEDRGQTWESSRLSRAGWQPRVDAAGSGVAVTWIGGGSAHGAYSQDGGLTFERTELGRTAFTNTHDVAVTGGAATVAFYDTEVDEIVVHRWVEGWQPAVQLSALPAGVTPTTGLKVRSDHDRTVAVMWMARPTAGSLPLMRIETSRNGGGTWGREVFTDSTLQVHGFGDLAVHNGSVHAVWRGTEALVEVFSIDATGEQYASRDIAATSTLQPRLAVTSAGVAVGWYAGHAPDARIHGYVATRRAGTPTWWTREVPSPSDGEGQGHAYDLVPTAQEGAAWGVAWVRISGPEGIFGQDDVVYRPSSFGPEDLEVLSTRLVQGPLDGLRLVADRGAVVHVRVRSTLDTVPRVGVRLRLVDADGRVDETLVKGVMIRPGVNDLFLDDVLFTELSPGTAEVEVDVDATDLVPEASETNNHGTDSRTVVRTTSLDVHFSVLGGTPLMAGPNPGAAFTMRAEAMRTAADLLPIDTGELRTGFFTPYLPSLVPGPHLSHTWVMLRELALQKQVYFRDVDMWVVVVPEGFFRTHSTDAKEARAVAAAGARLGVVMVEEQATSGSALAHEIAHDFGWVSEEYEDADSHSHMGGVPASGYSVRHGRLVREIDLMDRYDGDARRLTRWVSGVSWESLIDLIVYGEVANLTTAAAAVEASAAEEHLAVTGTVQPDGTITLAPVRTAEGAPAPAVEGDVTLRLLDDSGAELARTTAASGQVADADVTGGRVFTAQLPAVEGAARVDVTSGTASGSAQRSAPPQVQVLAPTAPVVVAAGSPVPVQLEVTDPDGNDVTTTLEVDDGTGWGQVGQVVDGLGEIVPGRLLTGQSLQVRAVATDGWGTTVVPLPGIKVEADRALGDLLVDKYDSSGTDEPLWPLDVEALPPAGGSVTTLLRPDAGGQPITPSSSPDGRQLSFSEGTSGDLVVAAADGTQRRTLVDGLGPRGTSCGRWSPDGRKLVFYRSSSQLPEAERGLYVVDVASGSLQQVADASATGNNCHLGWADGAVHFLARTSADNPVRSAFRVAPDGTDRQLVLAPATGAELRALATSRDGRQVAVAEATAASQRLHTRLLVLQAGSSAAREVRAVTGRDQHQSLTFGPTGEDLASVVVDLAASSRTRIDVLDLLTGEQRTGIYASPADHKNYGSVSWRALRAPEPGPRLVADAGGPYEVQEGGTLTVTGADSRADAGGLQLAWDTDGDGVLDTEGTTATVQAQDDGDLEVPLVATDALGQAERTAAVVTVTNAAPALSDAVAVRDATGVSVGARATDPGVDDVLTARVIWSDGTSTAAQAVRDGSGWAVTARRDGAPDGELVLVLSDGTDDDAATLEPAPAPVGTAPQLTDRTVTVGAGQAVVLDDVAVDPDGDAVALVATGGSGSTALEDGAGTAGGPRLTHVAAATTGTYAVSLTATDARGLTASAVLTVEVVPAVAEQDPAPVDLPPTVSAGPDLTGVEGGQVSLTGSAEDDGSELTVGWTASRADCSVSAAAATSTTVTCRDDGPVELVLTADDGVHPPVSDSATVTITNAAPTVAISSPAPGATVPVDSEVAIVADVLDAGSDDVLSCDVDLGDGTTATVAAADGRCELVHRWPTGGTKTVTVVVSDGDGGTATATQTIEVLAADSLGVRLIGAGVTTEPQRAALRFAVTDRTDDLRAGLVLAGSGGPRFTSTSAEGWVSDGRTSRWRGTGRWGRTDGYRYTVEVVRQDTRKGLAESRVTLVVTAPDGTEVWRTPSTARYIGGTLLLAQ